MPKKLYLLDESRQKIGGGWSFLRSFQTGLQRLKNPDWELADRWQDADAVLLAGATLASRETVKGIRANDIPLILRVDNAPRNSNNRNTGTSRLKDFAQMATAVIYQSKWALDYLTPFLGVGGRVIYNGVDREVFKPDGIEFEFKGKPTYLYSRFGRSEGKGWENAWYRYQQIQRENKDAQLVIVGKFSDELREYNFDFFQGENYQYMGIIADPHEMAKIYRGCDYLMATYENDCYSNTYLEALACGCKLFEPRMSGGTPELVENGVRSCEDMVKDYLEVMK